MNQNRFKSPVVWASITAQILSLLVTLNVIDTGMSAAMNAVVVSVLEVLVAFGVMNNPTDGAAF